MERKLASVRIISELLPIDGADKIELATVDGWKVVVAKDVGHKVGDKVIYCEIDSFLPVRPEFEFLRKSSYKKMADGSEGFRLRTIKLKGQISQGLILPISLIEYTNLNFEVGMDVTLMLGINKYEPPIPAELAGKVKGLFPSFIPKTDEERIQNLAADYENFKSSDMKFYVTEKLDGSSATFYIRYGEFGICSRNLELLESDTNTFWRVAKLLDVENKMKSLNKNISFQGELVGEGIQGNPYKIIGQTVRFFNIYDIDNRKYLDFQDFISTLDFLGLNYVPVLSENFKLPETIDELINFADDKSQLNQNFDREGIVIRSYDKSVSFKVISNKFLLSEK